MVSRSLRYRLKARAKAFGFLHLSHEAQMSRQALYKFLQGGDIRYSNLEKIAELLGVKIAFNFGEADSEDILANLQRFGAPLLMGAPKIYLNLEQTIVESLRLVSKENRLTSILPYLFVLKHQSLEGRELFKYINNDQRLLRLLGYFLDVAQEYRYRNNLEKIKNEIDKKLVDKKFVVLSQRDKGKAFLSFSRFDNAIAKKWKVGTRDELSFLIERCRKWEKSEQPT